MTVSFVDGIPAYPATDIVCAVSSRRFNANWMNYEPDATYTLNVYTKNANGQPQPFGTYTTTDTTYQVKNVQPNTTYYYKVSIIEDGEELVGSNEVTLEMPEVAPVFSVSLDNIAFTATPGNPSAPTQVSVTAMAVPKYVTEVITSAPFELSSDGEAWGIATKIFDLARYGAVKSGNASD